jgi:hypothetical protein
MNQTPAKTILWWQKINRILTPQRLSYGWIAGGALWIAWLVSIILGPGTLDLANQVVGTDYLQFYAAGKTLLQGKPDQLYDFEFQSQLESFIAGPGLVNFHAFITPPFLAWLFVPLCYLPYTWSFTIWSLAGLLFLGLSLYLLGAHQPGHKMIWSLCWFPVFAAISFGQNSLLSLLILSLVFYLWSRHHKVLSGLCASFLLYKPQLLLGIGMLWLFRFKKDWRSLLGLFLGTGFTLTASLLWLPSATLDYIKLARDFLPGLIYQEQFPLYHLHALRGFIFTLFPGQIWLAETTAILLTIIGIYSFYMFVKRASNEPQLQFAAAICLTIWITPHAMIYDWTLLLIPAILLWQSRPRLKQFWTATFSIIWLTTFLSGPLTYLQLQVLPFALQISVPIFLFIIINTIQQLYPTLQPAPNTG